MSDPGTSTALPISTPAVPEPAGASPALRRDSRTLWLLLLAVLLFTAALRIRLIPVPLERDEGEYAYAGQLILQGVPPYTEVYNMKMPGIYACYALVLTVFGQTHTGIHTALVLINGASIVLVFLIGRRLIGDWPALAAAAVFAAFSLCAEVHGPFANAEQFVLVPVLGGILLLLAQPPPRLGRVFLAGLLLGLGFIIKQHAAAFIAGAGLYVVARAWRDPEKGTGPILPAAGPPPASGASRRRLVRVLVHAALFSVGVFIPFLTVVAIYLYLNATSYPGVFGRFWFWTVTYARQYVSESSLAVGWAYFKLWSPFYIGSPTLPLWVLSLVGLLSPVWGRRWGAGSAKSAGPGAIGRSAAGWLSGPAVRADRDGSETRPTSPLAVPGDIVAPPDGRSELGPNLGPGQRPGTLMFMLGLLIFSAIAISPGLYFRPHYFVLTLPALALWAGLGAQALAERLAPLGVFGPALAPGSGLPRWSPLALVVVAIIATLFFSREYLFEETPTQIAHGAFGMDPFPEALLVGDYIRAHTKPGDRILVMGSEPEICFYAQRRSSTGYIYMYPLMEIQPYAHKMQAQLIREVEANPPTMMVYVRIRFSWDIRRDSDPMLEEWRVKYSFANFERVGLVDLYDANHPRNYLDDDGIEHTPQADFAWMAVYKRRDKPLKVE